MNIAYTCIIDGPNKQGKHYRLVIAQESGGYYEMKETGELEDPFYVAKGPIWFNTREEGEAEAHKRNEKELGLTKLEAGKIIMKSIGNSVT